MTVGRKGCLRKSFRVIRTAVVVEAKSSLRVPSSTRPRATATRPTVRCIASASTGSVGRRPLRAAMPTTWASATEGSARRATVTVRTVFRCVASRNTQRVFYWGSLRLISNRACGQKSGSASLASHTPSGPNPLGENQSLSSPPLEPRGLLLSVMRQKVGKERSQGVFAPLAIPRQPPPGESSARRPPP